MKNVSLNNYERFYFEKFFKYNIKRLNAFRKSLAKDTACGINSGEPHVKKIFYLSGGRRMIIELSKKKVDAYIKEINNEII